MISLKNILTISKFETKVLWRNWFFRIFSIGILFFLTIFNLAGFSNIDIEPWHLYSNSWGGPYANMIILSIGQAAAIIFLATGIIKKDKKIDTNEVFFVRPVSNIDFVFGKALAVFKMFIALNAVILLMNLVINLTNPHSPFNPLGYLIYPALSSVPTIIFTTGMAFLLVTLIRNQPISIVILVGLSGVVLIYFFGKHSNIFDYMAFRISMMASDMIGFSNLEEILLQRSFYFVTGFTCLFATALFLQRLPDNNRFKYFVAVITLFFVAGSSFLMIKLWNEHQGRRDFRESMIEVNGNWIEVPNGEVISNSIDLEHRNDKIIATSMFTVKNFESESIDQVYFTLNPGLKVTNFKIDQKEMEFEREIHIISAKLRTPLKPGEHINIELNYEGSIMDEVAYLDVNHERYEFISDYFVYSIHKEFAFLKPEYVLLTKDVLWYPDTQIGFSKVSPVKERTSFIDFELRVQTPPGLTAISQGTSEVGGNGLFHFKPEYPLPQISLSIGSYNKKEIEVDSINYAIYYYPGNEYFSKYLNDLEDTLSYLIKDLKNEYEHDQQISYPFKRLQIVEVPVQFKAFNRIYENHQSYVQPETVYLPEKGGDVRALDIRRQLFFMEEQAREENLVLSEREKQANVFKDLVKRVFTGKLNDRFFFDGSDSDDALYSIFPNLYAYNSGIVSREWPLFSKSISVFLNKLTPPGNDFSRNLNGISFTEECNQLMREASIMEILTTEENFNKIQKSLTLKGDYLFSHLSQLIGEEDFKTFLYDWINKNSHQLTTYSNFQRGIREQFNVNVDPIIRRAFLDTSQPAYEITNLKELEILDGDRKRYQVIFDVKNVGSIDGVIKVNFFYWEEENQFQFFGPEIDEDNSDKPGYLSIINSGQTKQLGFVMDNPPDQVAINTLVSQNIPSIVRTDLGNFKSVKNAIAFTGERIIENAEVINQDYEVIVDNEDAGFSTFSPIKETYLRAYLDSRDPSDKKYYGSWRRSYSNWLATTGSDFYGDYIRSAHFTRSGKGEKITTWTPDLKEGGFYDIYVYMMGRNQNQYVGRSNEGKVYTYQYLINHGDGTDEISYNLSNAERGWNYLGSYYFKEGQGSIILTDKCELRTVYADAIKWVKQL